MNGKIQEDTNEERGRKRYWVGRKMNGKIQERHEGRKLEGKTKGKKMNESYRKDMEEEKHGT